MLSRSFLKALLVVVLLSVFASAQVVVGGKSIAGGKSVAGGGVQAGASGWGSGTISQIQVVHHYFLAGFAITSANANDLLICGVSSDTAGVQGISDTNTNTWNHITQFTGAGAALIDIWWAAAKAGATTITLTSAGDSGGTCAQYRSTVTATAPVFDNSTTGTSASTSATPSATAFSTSGPGMIWAYYSNETTASTITIGAPFTSTNIDNTHVDAQEEILNTTANSYTPLFNSSPAVASYAIVAIAIK